MDNNSTNQTYEQLLLPLNFYAAASRSNLIMDTFTGRDIYSASESIDADYDNLPQIKQSYDFSTLSPSNNDYNSFVFIKSRAQVFRQFMDQCKNKVDEIKNCPVNEDRNECKKRTKYWAYKLFDEVPIHIDKVFYISSEENAPKWVTISKELTITPIGLDIWGTIGGVFQDTDSIEWEKSLLMFLPNNSLKSLLNAPFIDLCFTTPECIKLPGKSNNIKELKREIRL
jgi:hypothetical protein